MKKTIAIIGAGPAGYRLAIELNKSSPEHEVWLFEDKALGGTCLHSGCIPSKLLQSISKLEDYSKQLKKHQTILERGIASQIQNINLIKSKASIEINSQTAQFIIHSQDFHLESDIVFIATGSKPRQTQLLSNYYDSDSFWGQEFQDVYNFIGGGYIGVELASILAHHGKSTRIFESQDRILGFLDDDIHSKFTLSLEAQGISINTGFHDYNQLPAGTNVLAIGREPNPPEIFYDNRLLSDIQAITKLHEIFPKRFALLGDINSPKPLAHAAYAQAKLLAQAVQEAKPLEAKLDNSKIPMVIYSIPELALLGLSEKEAALNYDIEILERSWAANAMARLKGYERGWTKIILEKHSTKILGIQILGHSAAELISNWIAAINLGLTYKQCLEWIYPHPSLSELE